MNTTSASSVTGLRGYSVISQNWLMTMAPNQPITFVNQRFGTLQIGMVPGGQYDTFRFYENGGGGLLAVGYTYKDGELFVMMLKANRENLRGEDDIEMPGGFQDGNEATLTGAAREVIEETGVMPELRPLQGRNFVANRAFWCVSGEDEGTHAFCFELTDDQVTLVEADPRLLLMSWRDAVRTTRDALSGMVLARLLAELL